MMNFFGSIIVLAICLTNPVLTDQNSDIDLLWDRLKSEPGLDPKETLETLEKIRDGYKVELDQLGQSISDFLQAKIIDVAPSEADRHIDLVHLSESNPMSERRKTIAVRLARILFMIKVSDHSEDKCDVEELKKLIRMIATNDDAPSIERYIRFHFRQRATICEPVFASEIRSKIYDIGEANIEPFLNFDEKDLAGSLADFLKPYTKSEVDYSDLKTFTLLYEDKLIEVCSPARHLYRLLDVYSYMGEDNGLNIQMDGKTIDWLEFLSTCKKIEEDMSMIRYKNLFTRTHSKLMERLSLSPQEKGVSKSKGRKPSWAKKMFGDCFTPKANE